jgi:hypothetical protein
MLNATMARDNAQSAPGSMLTDDAVRRFFTTLARGGRRST